MKYYMTCPYCGANLDPGESCDCEKTHKGSEKQKQEVKRNWKIGRTKHGHQN